VIVSLADKTPGFASRQSTGSSLSAVGDFLATWAYRRHAERLQPISDRIAEVIRAGCEAPAIGQAGSFPIAVATAVERGSIALYST
jgi:hypothetical protein